MGFDIRVILLLSVLGDTVCPAGRSINKAGVNVSVLIRQRESLIEFYLIDCLFEANMCCMLWT